ncbi:UNVERIFIED_CONTAM: hypothetical protein H355_003963, partial [Colinus virginianus]
AAGVAISSSQANQKLFSSQVLLPFTSSVINDVHDRAMARKIRALLPNIMETTSTGNTHVILEALRIFKNVMGHLGMREASSSAVTVAEKMLPLFNHTLHAMDEMLKIVLDNYPTLSVTEELHGILEVCLLQSSVLRGLFDRIYCALFMGTAVGAAGVAISSSQANQKLFSSQVLLPFTSSVVNDVHDRAMVRMWKVCGFLASRHWGKVPQILGYIHRNLGSISTSPQHILFSVFDVLINKFPRDALMSVLTKLPQSDSTTLDIWKLMLHLPPPARILEELYSVLHDQQLCEIFNMSTAELGLLHLPVMPPTEGTLKDLCKPAALQSILKTESLPILWLGLRGLLLLSERRETVSRT